MRSLVDAQHEVLDAVAQLPGVRLPIWDVHGLCLVEPVAAGGDVPPFANSAMDGFAVRAVDVASVPVRLRVVDQLAAGHASSARVEPGTAIQIMTGAPIPVGADAVVKVEDTEPEEGAVLVNRAVEEGTAIRAAGSDIREGMMLASPGVRLGPAHVALLATAGSGTVVVHRRPRVAILSTGDEVKAPETKVLEPGWIRDANRPLLRGLLAEVGVDVADYGIVPDDRRRLRDTLERAAATCDVVVTSGGVSMGEYDLVKHVLTEIGGVGLWRVAMQPAKPFAFGKIGSTPFFGLPGNPVSVLVSFEQFLRPALLTMLGSSTVFRPRIMGVSDDRWKTDPAKTVFTRVAVDWSRSGPVAALPEGGGQGSHVLSTTANANAFAVVPEGTAEVAAGDEVSLEMFRWPASRTRREALGG